MTARRGALLAMVIMAVFAGCAPPDEDAAGAESASRAEWLAQDAIIVDTHVDVPYRLAEKMDDISERTEDGHFDYPRAREGGLDAAFMSIYVPASLQTEGGAKALADELIDMVEKFAVDWPDKFALARSPDDVRQHLGQGLISLPMGMENGAPIEGDLTNLLYFHERGIRYITLTHSENNRIGDSSYADEPRWNGLSPFGREVVAEMNRLGIMIDVSHITDATFFDVLEVSEAPVIASHSSCRRFTPGWERNMDDEMIRLLASKGGVIQINFGSAFLFEEARRQSMAFWQEYGEYLEANGIDSDHERAVTFRKEYWKTHQRVYGDLSDVMAHIEHVVRLVGVDHVGFGSDFDGVGALPEGLKDVSHYPNLIRKLLEHGYSEEDVRKICGENLLRVWSEVEDVARDLQSRG